MTGTEIASTQNNWSMAVYDRLGDPIQAADSVGSWLHQAGMTKTPGAGKILALAAMCMGENVVKVATEYQIVMGRLTRNYDLLLADLRAAGGDYEWKKNGDDGKEACLVINWKKKSHEYSFTIDMAKQAGLVKPDSNWEKWPGNMLRSKCVRNGMKMYCPEVIGGFTTPEDVDDIAASNSSSNANQEFDIEARRRELQAEASKPAEPQKDVDAVTTEQLQIIAQRGEELGLTLQQVKDGITNRYKVDSIQELTKEQAVDAIDRMRDAIEKKRAELAGATT